MRVVLTLTLTLNSYDLEMRVVLTLTLTLTLTLNSYDLEMRVVLQHINNHDPILLPTLTPIVTVHKSES